MGLGVWNQGWLNENAQRRYPLSETATASDLTGTFQLPDDFLVDLIWSTHADNTIDPTKYHILAVVVAGSTVTVTFAYNGTPVTSISIGKEDHVVNNTYHGLGVGTDFYDDVVRITVGRLDSIFVQAPGFWSFDVAGGRLEPSVIRPDVRGVTSLLLRAGADAAEISDPLQDEVEIAAGANIRLSVATVGGRPQIRIDAISGVGLNQACDCTGVPLADPIRTINGIPPNGDGNFQFVGNPCIQINSLAAGLEFKELCANPCCGCQELEVLHSALQELRSRVTTLESFGNQLSGVVEQMLNTILVSKLSTQGDCG